MHKVKMRKSCSLNIRKFLIFFAVLLFMLEKRLTSPLYIASFHGPFYKNLKKLIQFRVYLKTFCLTKIISCNKSDLIPLAAKKSRNSTDLFSVLFTDFNLVRKWALLKFGMKDCLAKSCLFDLFTYPAIIEIIDYK